MVMHVFKRRHKNDRIGYYLKSYGSLLLPDSVFRHKANKLLSRYPELPDVWKSRLDYYCKLDARCELTGASSLAEFRSHKKSAYFLDLYPHLRAFPEDIRFLAMFGDVVVVPDQPSFVKSRPIHGDNRNSVLMKLDAVRHFMFVNDRQPFRSKRSGLTWRGRLHLDVAKERRLDFLQQFSSHQRFDIGHINGGDVYPEYRKPRMSIDEQLQFKYILSLEGVDVATNLKWIMSSNSLCFSQSLKYETWYMEGRLQPGVHFVEIADDFSDVEEKIDYYERHPEEAEQIIANANAYTKQFLDRDTEDLLAHYVIKRYLDYCRPA